MAREYSLENTRNFGIMAHIDAGKTTTSERILFYTGKNYKIGETHDGSATMDWMAQEQERGITITSAATTCFWKGCRLNIIDTPGHVDFTYEVSRSLAACEGALLIVDATQGVEAQTLANVYLALDNNLEIIPVINKIDLASADIEGAKSEIEDIIGLDASYAPCVSAKEGTNIRDILEAIVKYFPAPEGDTEKPLSALIFDSYYDNYKGVILFVRIKDGSVKVGTKIKTFLSPTVYEVTEVGAFSPRLQPKEILQAGEVGYIAASIKSIEDVAVGDTVTNALNPAPMPLPGYKKVQPVVFCGIFPLDGSKFNDLKDAIGKLKLNDASLTFEPDSSVALGFGFRCGFLGLLHMEIIQERIEREFNMDIITTAPSVSYKVHKTDGEEFFVDNPSHLPPASDIEYMEEPMVKAEIYIPPDYVGAIMELCQDKRGIFKNMEYVDSKRVRIEYRLPLNEIVYDFFDELKSRTKGYASFDYELVGYERSKLVKMDILLNGEVCDALSIIVHEDRAYPRGRMLCENLKDAIPRQLFEIPVQAAVGGKIIARETVKAVRKDVLAKCYGGDITRKRKLLEKQKEGKKRMRKVGSVDVPSEVFMEILKTNKD